MNMTLIYGLCVKEQFQSIGFYKVLFMPQVNKIEIYFIMSQYRYDHFVVFLLYIMNNKQRISSVFLSRRNAFVWLSSRNCFILCIVEVQKTHFFQMGAKIPIHIVPSATFHDERLLRKEKRKREKERKRE